MPLSADDVEAEAALLDEAEASATQVRQSTSVHPDMTMDDAYRVQAAWLRRKLARGQELVGHKIGLTSRAMQAAMNITTPDSGFLTGDMVFEPDSTLDAGRFCDPKLEIELAFVLAADLAGEDLSVDDVLDATDHVSPAVELIAAPAPRPEPQRRAPEAVQRPAEQPIPTERPSRTSVAETPPPTPTATRWCVRHGRSVRRSTTSCAMRRYVVSFPPTTTSAPVSGSVATTCRRDRSPVAPPSSAASATASGRRPA